VSEVFFKKNNQKKCIMSYNWFKKICTTKACPLLWKYMFIGWTWWKTKSYKKFKVLKIWRKGLQGKGLIFKPFDKKKMFTGFKMSSFRCKSHVQEIILPKTCLVVHWNSFWDFLRFFAFLALNKNIRTQLCMNVKNDH
jgi:hypothetical protein